MEELGVEPIWLAAEAVVDDRLEEELDRVPEGCGPALLRSWMLREDEYERLYDALAERGCYLVNGAAAYAEAHYLPNYYDAVAPWAAPTAWIDGCNLDEAWDAARSLGPPPYFLKDFVKSTKEDFASCYVPAGASRAEFDEVCERFLERRGDSFEGGLVVRRALALRPLGEDASGHPVHDEHRMFFWRGELLAAAPYYDVAADDADLSELAVLGGRIDSAFFTVDVARLVTGDWAVIEVGDGGVSTLPPRMDVRGFYRALFDEQEGELSGT